MIIFMAVASIFHTIANKTIEKNNNSTTPVPILSTSPTSIPSVDLSTTLITSLSTFPKPIEIPNTIIQSHLDYSTIYYPKCDSSYNSLVDALKSLSIDSSLSNRKLIAEINGISNYSGTSEQNIELLNKLKNGVLIKSISSTIIYIPVEETTSNGNNENKENGENNRGK